MLYFESSQVYKHLKRDIGTKKESEWGVHTPHYD